MIAGPKILNTWLDTVLQFEGDQHYAYRILRTIKNRFGSTAELGIYEMMGNGMRMVSNPSEILIPQKDEVLSGSSIAAVWKVCVLCDRNASAGHPKRIWNTTANVHRPGFRRLQLLLAVLEKRGGFHFG
jgi:DNA repair protein RadA/Sms